MSRGLTTRAAGPVDQSVTYAINDGLRRDADQLVAAVRRTPLAEAVTWQLLARRYDLFAAVLRVQAQGAAQGLWPALRERCTPEEARVLDAMLAEQDALGSSVALGAGMLARLAATPDEGSRAAVVVRLSAVRESLDRHLHHLESDAMPLLQALLTQGEWERIDHDHYVSQMSPAFLLALVPWVAHGQPQDVLDGVFTQVGRGFQVTWWLTRSRFARRERRTFRHA